jgi:hypothetical protein
MTDKFKTKQGYLTPYALACGYIEQTEIEGKRVTLWADGGAYHVRNHDFNSHSRVFWKTYERLTNARKAYRQAIKTNQDKQP